MKYCVKCGTLLEDTQMTCIACGTDVSLEENVSLYPPEMEKTITDEKQNRKKRTGLIAAIVGIFVVLVGLIAALVIFVSNNADSLAAGMEIDEELMEDYDDSSDEDYYEEPYEEEEEVETDSSLSEGIGDVDVISAETSAPEETPAAPQETEAAPSDRVVKDDVGTYYNVGTLSDNAGNLVFTTVYPEDFSVVASDISYDKYSTRFPESITYMVSNQDNSVQMTYMSPQHFWYRNSDKGKSRNNERDVFNYMTYYTYNGVQGYIEALINASYKDIKKLDFIEKKPLGENIDSKLSEISKAHTMTLTGDIGDYAKIASDTAYAAMAAECEADIYSYQATSRQGNTIYIDFYIPVIANTLSYSSTQENDKGEVVEWVTPSIIVFEAGSEEYYKQYKDAYRAFISSSKITREFLYDNYMYSQHIKSAVDGGNKPTGLNQAKLKEYHDGYSDSADIGAYNEGLYQFQQVSPETNSLFKNGTVTFSTSGAMQVGFYNSSTGKFFTSSDASEYPGEGYEDLEATVGSAPSEEAPQQEDQGGTV